MDNAGKLLIRGINFLNDIILSKWFFKVGASPNNLIMDLLFFKTPLSSFGMHYAVLGGKCNFLKIELYPNKIYHLDLTDVVKDGKIVYINYTPCGAGLLPIQMHGNIPVSDIPSIIDLYPVPCIPTTQATTTDVSILYWYFDKNKIANVVENSMIKGFESYQKGYYESMVIELHTAIEVLLTQSIEKFIENFQLTTEEIENNKLRKNFYAKRKQGLPYMATKIKVPLLSEPIRKTFYELVKCRNEIMHEGKAAQKITQDRASLYIAHAFLYYRYLKLFFDN